MVRTIDDEWPSISAAAAEAVAAEAAAAEAAAAEAVAPALSFGVAYPMDSNSPSITPTTSSAKVT